MLRRRGQLASPQRSFGGKVVVVWCVRVLGVLAYVAAAVLSVWTAGLPSGMPAGWRHRRKDGHAAVRGHLGLGPRRPAPRRSAAGSSPSPAASPPPPFRAVPGRSPGVQVELRRRARARAWVTAA